MCGRGSLCDACMRQAAVRLDWPSWSGHYCHQCAQRLLNETECNVETTLLEWEDAVQDTALRT